MHLSVCVIVESKSFVCWRQYMSLNSRLWLSDRTTRSIRGLGNTWELMMYLFHYCARILRFLLLFSVDELLARTEQTVRLRQTTGAEEREYSCVSECVHVRWTVTKVSAERRHFIVLSALFSWLTRLKWRVRHQSLGLSVCVSVCKCDYNITNALLIAEAELCWLWNILHSPWAYSQLTTAPLSCIIH